jgi:hypothetical protein
VPLTENGRKLFANATLIFSVSSFLPLRVLLLGLSVLSKPEDFLFEALVLLAFLFEAFVGFIGDEFQVVGEFGQL